MKGVKPRIKKVFEKSLENLGKPLGQIMREEGYSDNTADNPKNVTESKSWEILLDEFIPESLILKTHKEAFEANRTISVVSGKQATGSSTDFVDVPDWQTRTKACELGYKVRGKLTEKIDHTTNGKDLPTPLLNGIYHNLSNEEAVETNQED
jgi:hypothetical protein